MAEKKKVKPKRDRYIIDAGIKPVPLATEKDKKKQAKKPAKNPKKKGS